jgi:hypothetical protein
MGDKTKKPRDKKKLEINKETIQELTDQDLDQVAGGATGGCATGEGIVVPTVTRGRVNTAGETCGCSAPPCA